MTEKIKTARQMLGRFFQERREDLKLSRHALAKRLGISEETVRGVESGRFAWDIDLHLRICKALGIRHELIASNEEQPAGLRMITTVVSAKNNDIRIGNKRLFFLSQTVYRKI